MIKQYINIDNYWKIIVYYNIDYNLLNYIIKDLKYIKTKQFVINRTLYTMATRKAKAVTISNKTLKISVVLFNTHTNLYDYINSIAHEAEHIKQAMLDAYNVYDEGEPPAYTIGYIMQKMLHIKILKEIGLKNS